MDVYMYVMNKLSRRSALGMGCRSEVFPHLSIKLDCAYVIIVTLASTSSSSSSPRLDSSAHQASSASLLPCFPSLQWL